MVSALASESAFMVSEGLASESTFMVLALASESAFMASEGLASESTFMDRA